MDGAAEFQDERIHAKQAAEKLIFVIRNESA